MVYKNVRGECAMVDVGVGRRGGTIVTGERLLSVPAARRFHGSLDAWVQAGLPECDAVGWWAAGNFSVGHGALWWRAGYSPQQAEFVRALCRHAVVPSPGDDVSSPAAWRNSGLPPHVVCLCLAAGIRSVAEGRAVSLVLVLRPDMYRVLTDRAMEAGFNPWQQSQIESRPLRRIRWHVHARAAVCRAVEACRTVACSRAKQARATRAGSRSLGSGDP